MQSKLILFMLSTFFVFLSIVLTFVFKSTLYLMMGWNMVLSIMTLLIILAFIKVSNKYLRFLLVVLWILFFPNTFYFITDLIHIARFEFFDQLNYSNFFVKNIEGYTFLVFILLGTLISLKIGLESLNEFLIYNIENKLLKLSNFLILFSISFLSSTGIYIGRFLRFNSWDVLNPLYLIRSFLKDIDSYTFAFVSLFTIAHLVIIYYDQHERGLLWKKL